MAAKEMSNKRKAAPSSSEQKTKKIRKEASVQHKDPKISKKDTSSSVSSLPSKGKPKRKDDTEDKIVLEDADDDTEAVAEVEEDDQTAALLQGFESSDDEEQGRDANEATTITTIPTIPSSDALQTSLVAANAAPSQKAGVIYLGRVPHGFFESQMRSYFSQFGDIARLRLSRNRRTGASKHYAFIEFKSDEVARIVADTMNNYLMFGHLLKVKLVPSEQVHAELFKGANSRFKAVPWNRIERFRLQATDRKGWCNRVEVEERRRQEKAEKMKAFGYEFEAPSLKQVEDVPLKEVVDGHAASIESQSAAVAETAKQVEAAEVKALESGTATKQGKGTQGPVSAEPLAIATTPVGGTPVTAEEPLSRNADDVAAETVSSLSKPGKQTKQAKQTRTQRARSKEVMQSKVAKSPDGQSRGKKASKAQ